MARMGQFVRPSSFTGSKTLCMKSAGPDDEAAVRADLALINPDTTTKLGDDERIGLVHIVRAGRVSRADYERLTGVTTKTAQRQLRTLVDAKLVEPFGEVTRQVVFTRRTDDQQEQSRADRRLWRAGSTISPLPSAQGGPPCGRL